MVEYAAHFRSKLFTNTLPGLSLPSAVTKKVGLLGHSVGAGLATFVAQQAAQDKQPFKAVMYMAPQTQVRRGTWHLLDKHCCSSAYTPGSLLSSQKLVGTASVCAQSSSLLCVLASSWHDNLVV